MNNSVKLLVVIIFCCLRFTAHSQKPTEIKAAIDKKSPDFSFNDVRYWIKKRATLNDFKGKWLVLYAWSAGCSACAESFPKLNVLKEQIKDEANLLLVGQENPYIRSWYEKFRVKRNLTLPIAYDSSFFDLFEIYSVPQIVIIDPAGVVRSVTATSLNKERLEQLFSGKGNPFSKFINLGDIGHLDDSKPLLINGNGGEDSVFLFRSLLTGWKYGQGKSLCDFYKYKWSLYYPKGIQLAGVALKDMYKIAYMGTTGFSYWDTAYYGKYCKEPVLDMRDTSAFQFDFFEGRNMYSYSLIVPDSLATDDYLQHYMQQDMEKYFGYQVSFEEREMPVLEAVKTRNLNHLKTKGGKKVIFYGMAYSKNLELKNVPVLDLFSAIAGYNSSQTIIDKTGIDFNIDVELKGILTDINEVNHQLNEIGINLVRSTRKMKVLVIKDPILFPKNSL